MATKVLTLTITDNEDGETFNCNTKFHKDINGAQLLPTMGQAVKGILQSMFKIGEAYGLSQEDILNNVFGGDEDE